MAKKDKTESEQTASEQPSVDTSADEVHEVSDSAEGIGDTQASQVEAPWEQSLLEQDGQDPDSDAAADGSELADEVDLGSDGDSVVVSSWRTESTEASDESAQGLRTIRSSRTVRDRQVRQYPSGRELVTSTTHIEESDDGIPIPYQGPASEHPLPVG